MSKLLTCEELKSTFLKNLEMSLSGHVGLVQNGEVSRFSLKFPTFP